MTEEEQSQLSTKRRRLKMHSKDGKMRLTDTLDTESIMSAISNKNNLKYKYIDNNKIIK
jgi:hypothetical protein